MNLIPENLVRLHQGEEFLRTKSLELIETDADLSRHVAIIEKAMDVLNLLSKPPATDEDEDTEAVRLLGMRLFNGCASAFSLTTSGYYQVAAMVMRDLLETVFLLGFFHNDPTKIFEWRTADSSARKKVFSPVKVRTALDDKDGFTEKKRAAAYDLLCELASHPTYKGFRMLRPQGLSHHCGPFLDPTSLKALIEELAKLAIQAAQNFLLLFKTGTKESIAAHIHFMEACGEWFERYFRSSFDRKEIEELKALLAQM